VGLIKTVGVEVFNMRLSNIIKIIKFLVKILLFLKTPLLLTLVTFSIVELG
jgi:hypothetical protein